MIRKLQYSKLSPKQARKKYHWAVIASARRYGISSRLLEAVIEAESGWNIRAKSPQGACGLTQLMPATAKRLGVRNVFDPVQNIDGGARQISYLMKMFKGDLPRVLAAYNMGEYKVIKLGHFPRNRETVRYVDFVVDRYVRPTSTGIKSL